MYLESRFETYPDGSMHTIVRPTEGQYEEWVLMHQLSAADGLIFTKAQTGLDAEGIFRFVLNGGGLDRIPEMNFKKAAIRLTAFIENVSSQKIWQSVEEYKEAVNDEVKATNRILEET